MAKKGNDTFTPSGWNGPDPKITGGQFDENKGWYRDLQNENSVAGDGNQSGQQFQDSGDMYTLEGFNVIDSRDPNYPGKSQNVVERTTVDVSRANRGKEF